MPDTVRATPRVAIPPGFTTAEERLRLLAWAIDAEPQMRKRRVNDSRNLLIHIVPIDPADTLLRHYELPSVLADNYI